MNIYLKSQESEIQEIESNIIANHINNIVDTCTSGLVRHISISRKKVGIYIQIPLGANLENLVETIRDSKSPLVPEWDEHFTLLSVGIPYKKLEEALENHLEVKKISPSKNYSFL